MKNYKINKKINLKLTQESGQTSQAPWNFDKDVYYGLKLIGDVPVLLKVSQDNINSLNYSYEFINEDKTLKNKIIKEEIARIFDLSFDLDKFYNYLSNDEKLQGASDFCNGLRLFLAKDIFECIIASISSSNNSIIRWSKSMDEIAFQWGDIYNFKSGTFYSFPKVQVLSEVFESPEEESEFHNKNVNVCINNLKTCGVGYRSDYILKASEYFLKDHDLNDFYKMNYDEAFQTILEVQGVGPKVADCILLYGYGFKEAFPSDVWIKRIVSHLYFNDKDVSTEKIREFGIDKFGDYAGYVQLYLFHYARKSGLMDKLTKK